MIGHDFDSASSIDLTRLGKEYDITTLDGLNQKVYKLRISSSDLSDEGSIEYQKRLEQKIKASSNLKGCAMYAGIEETTLQK